MEVKEVVKKRRSVRSYRDKEISDQDLKEVLNSARMAPSASNRQEWKFIVIKKEGLKKELAEAAQNQKFVGEAPVVLVAVSLNPDRIMSCEVPAYAVDLAIAMDHVTLVAADKGLGTCWIGAFSQPKVKEILEIPGKYKVVTLMPLGYPADSPRSKSRKSFDDVVCYDRFQ